MPLGSHVGSAEPANVQASSVATPTDIVRRSDRQRSDRQRSDKQRCDPDRHRQTFTTRLALKPLFASPDTVGIWVAQPSRNWLSRASGVDARLAALPS